MAATTHLKPMANEKRKTEDRQPGNAEKKLDSLPVVLAYRRLRRSCVRRRIATFFALSRPKAEKAENREANPKRTTDNGKPANGVH
jgi:hypothetical protein